MDGAYPGRFKFSYANTGSSIVVRASPRYASTMGGRDEETGGGVKNRVKRMRRCCLGFVEWLLPLGAACSDDALALKESAHISRTGDETRDTTAARSSVGMR